MEYLFPKFWIKNINTIDQLSEIIGLDKDFLIKNQFIKNKYISKPKRKKDGSFRNIIAPNKNLKLIQRKILKNIFNFSLGNRIQGGVIGGSIVNNANFHKNKKWVLNLDINNFFPSISHSRIERVFQCLGCSNDVSRILTNLTTFNKNLPQGAPTSPAISNLILFNFDKRIINLCRNNGFYYSRYIDDITISSNRDLTIIHSTISNILKQEGFNDQKNKGGVLHPEMEKIVTGLIVNKNNLRPNEVFICNLLTDIEMINLGDTSNKTVNRLNGRLAFLKSVNVDLWFEYKNYNKI